jgi:hypothetical protein
LQLAGLLLLGDGIVSSLSGSFLVLSQTFKGYCGWCLVKKKRAQTEMETWAQALQTAW